MAFTIRIAAMDHQPRAKDKRGFKEEKPPVPAHRDCREDHGAP